VSDALHIPLVPAECDLKDFAFMPLEFRRLFTSETWMLGNDAAKLAALHLWCESWHQVPAASLPDNDRALSLLSQAGSRWKRVKEHAMRGWVLCSDGRLYHPVVAEKALEAWGRKLEQRARTHAARVAALQKKIEKAVTAEEKGLLHAQLQALLQEPVTASKGQGQWKGEGQGQNPKSKSDSAASRRPAGATMPLWDAYSAAYRERYSVDPVRNAKVNGMLASFLTRVPQEEAPAIAAFYVGHGKSLYVSARHCVDLLLRDAEGLRTEWATGRKVTDAEARQSDRTAATGDQVNRLLDEARRAA
jgi:hypothetical protein